MACNCGLDDTITVGKIGIKLFVLKLCLDRKHTMERNELLELISNEIVEKRVTNGVFRVGIDGPSTSGKTHFGRDLAATLREKGIQVVEVSIDRFHNPRAIRHRQGKESPQGYFEDSFNRAAILDLVFKPLADDGDRQVRTAAFDYRTDLDVECKQVNIPNGSVLVMEGIFLFAPDLDSYWDMRIFLSISQEEVLRRAVLRDSESLGGEENVRRLYKKRYLPAEWEYAKSSRIMERAEWVIDHHDFDNPIRINSGEQF